MTTTIAIAGKGGTGKTTIAALLIQMLASKGVVLAVDGDPSSNLHLALGLPLSATVGEVREGMLAAVKKRQIEPSLSKQDYLDLRVHEALVESRGIDLLAMGRPEGPGCYCAANSMLRTIIDRLENNYDYVVIDNEAGMEHISRQTTQEVGILLIISDLSMRGIITASRTRGLIQEMRTSVGRMGLVVNRVDGELPPPIDKAIKESGLELIGLVPQDPQVTELDSRGAPIVELPEGSPLRQAVGDIAKRLGLI